MSGMEATFSGFETPRNRSVSLKPSSSSVGAGTPYSSKSPVLRNVLGILAALSPQLRSSLSDTASASRALTYAASLEVKRCSEFSNACS
jgi:hypothetical protein